MLRPPSNPFARIWSSRPWAISAGWLLLHMLPGVYKALTGLYDLADDVKSQDLCFYSSSEPCCMAHSSCGWEGPRHLLLGRCLGKALAQVLPHATLW